MDMVAFIIRGRRDDVLHRLNKGMWRDAVMETMWYIVSTMRTAIVFVMKEREIVA